MPYAIVNTLLGLFQRKQLFPHNSIFSAQNAPKKIKIHSKFEKGFPRYFIEEYSNAPVFESLYTLVRHYQRVPFSVEKCPLILKRPIEEPRNFAKET